MSLTSSPIWQLLAQKGLLPKGGMPPTAGAPPPPGPGPQRTTTPGQTPTQMNPAGPVSSTAPPAYNIRRDPRASIGTLPQPTVTQQPLNPVAPIEELFTQWFNRKQKKEQGEAANAAQNLMQAIEGAKTSGDWAPVESIMHEHEKLFNKVYKGWLQKAETQKKQGAQKPDEDIQGFEQGVSQYLQGKQGQPPAAAPRTMGGYYLPQAGPQQAFGQQALSAETQARAQDPARALQGQMRSGETRQAELGAAGLAMTPKMDVEIKKAALEVTKYQHEAQKAAAEFLAAQQRLQLGEKVEEGKLAELRLRNQKAQTDLDIARQKLERERIKTKGTQQMNQSYRLKFSAVKQAETAIGSLIGGKITNENVMGIINLLKQAGATGIAQNLLDQQKTWYKSYSTPEQLRDALQAYKKSFQDAFHLDDQGNVVEESEEPDSDMPDDTATPEGETPEGYPPGWTPAPATPKKP